MSFETGDNSLNSLSNTNVNLNDGQDKDANTQGLNDHYSAGAMFGESNPFGLSSINLSAGRIAGTSMSGALTSEKYNKILKKMQEMANDPNNDKGLLRHILALDKSVAPTVHFATIIVAVQSKVAREVGVGYQLLVIDGSNVPLQNLESNTNNMLESIDRFAEVVIDDQLRALAVQRILSLIPEARAEKIFPSTGVVISDETDAENEQQIFQVLNNAVLAAQSAVAYRVAGGYQDLDLTKHFSAGKGGPELSISHTPSKTVYAPDEVGNLSRVSFVSRLQVGKASKNRNESPNSGQQVQSLLEVGTFSDLLPILPPNGQNPMMPYGMQQGMMLTPQGQMLQPLRPLVVMTTVRSSFALTPGAIELGAIVASDQVRSNRWAEDYRHKGNPIGAGIDFGNIGAILVNLPNPQAPGETMGVLDASSHMFTDETLWALLGNYVRNAPLLAIDVPTAAASSWYLGMYAALASKKSKHYAGALKFYTKTLDTLTNGNYTRLVNEKHSGNAPAPFLDDVYYLERGTWRVGERLLPLELVDNYVAVCSFAAYRKQPGLVEEYVSTLTNPQVSQISRLLKRRAIINEMTDGTARFTRSVKRCIFNPVHRDLVNEAVVAAGLVVHSDEAIQLNLGANVGYVQSLANVPAMQSSLNVVGVQQQNFGFGQQSTWMGY